MIFPAEKRLALMQRYGDAEERRSYIKGHTLQAFESSLQRLNQELDRFDEKDLEGMVDMRDLTLFHRVVLDLQEQCELLDLSMQRTEQTYVPESPIDVAVFRDFSRRIAMTFERAFLRREMAEALYKSRRAAASGRGVAGALLLGGTGAEFCLDPASVVEQLAGESGADAGKAPVLSHLVGALQKIFSCTMPRK